MTETRTTTACPGTNAPRTYTLSIFRVGNTFIRVEPRRVFLVQRFGRDIRHGKWTPG
jgi:hypothetical protein